MRSFVDLGLFLAAVALGIGTVLPVVGGVRPTEIPLVGLRDGFPPGDLGALAVHDLGLHESLAVPFAAAAALLLLAALFDSAITGWAGTVLALSVFVAFAVRVAQVHAEYVDDNRSTVLTNQNGFVLLLSGVLVAFVCCLVTVRRPGGAVVRG
ncbi:MAG: hypothetical protein GXY65_15235 [Rhodococcus sp.]|uniref:hypothetical protein n=1 Tax=Rhodococcus sp. TaxID=1831 RepID=UPI0016BAC447|nr:hypothetical protein [Rhodococcus sp. (in: high G+C Gram-positive bacteria)]NLV80657.1 hypothetical protein [Rhodococcus sp. (in: high G+C Gram-positive bacteria)]